MALALRLTGARFSPAEPLAAGIIASVAGIVAVLPLLRTRQKDPVTIVQRALIGTVLHVLCTAVMSGVLVVTHVVTFHGPFIFWLLGAYWFSLAILVWQLRQLILAMTANVGQPQGNISTNLRVQN